MMLVRVSNCEVRLLLELGIGIECVKMVLSMGNAYI